MHHGIGAERLDQLGIDMQSLRRLGRRQREVLLLIGCAWMRPIG
jgi:hypothetical protein